MTTEQLIIKIKDINSEIEYYGNLLDNDVPTDISESYVSTVELTVSGNVIKVPITYNTVFDLLYSKLKELRSELNHHEQMLLKSLK